MSLDDLSSTKRTRASGEVLDYLLTEFENNHNPLPEQRKEIADKTNMNEKAVRIWFQNRRAKLRKLERMGVSGLALLLRLGLILFGDTKGLVNSAGGASGSGSGGNGSNIGGSGNLGMSSYQLSYLIELNEYYCFIDCLSLLVGSWQRLRSGIHDDALLTNSLINLAPLTLGTVMQNADLLVILLRRNQELNYFFAAVSNNIKVFFRIFYPLTSIATCSLLDNNISQEQSELRLSLLHTPKFSVYFSSTELNQWLICEDFSEGQQVLKAHGMNDPIPHVLVGSKPLLQYLNAYILENQLTGPNSNSIDINSNIPNPHDPIIHSEAGHGIIGSSTGITSLASATESVIGSGGPNSLAASATTSPSLPLNHNQISPANGNNTITSSGVNPQVNNMPVDLVGISLNDETNAVDLELRFDWQPHILPLGDLETLPALMVLAGLYHREFVPEMAEEPLAPVSYTHQQHSPEGQENLAQPQVHLNTPQSHDFEFVLGNDFVAHTPLENNAALNQPMDSFIDYNSYP